MDKLNKIIFDSKSEIVNIKEKFLQTVFKKNNVKDIKKLSASQQNSYISALIRRLIETSADRMNSIDTRGVDVSKGSFKKIRNYIYFKNALTKLKRICDSNRIKVPAVDEVIQLEANILKYESKFKESYSKKKKAGILLYRTLALSWTYAICLSISKLIDYDAVERNESGSGFKIRSYNNLERSNTIINIKRFNKEFKNKTIDKYFENSEIFNESIVAVVSLAVAAVAFLVYALRAMVEIFYHLKDIISKEANIVAEFLDANAGTLDDKKTRDKQRALAAKLRKLSVSLQEKDYIASSRAEEVVNDEQMDVVSPDNSDEDNSRPGPKVIDMGNPESPSTQAASDSDLI